MDVMDKVILLAGCMMLVGGVADMISVRTADGSELPPHRNVDQDGTIHFEVVEYRADNGHTIRCMTPEAGKVECYY